MSPIILLAVGAAIAYGASDFVGGLLSRHWPAGRVALVGQSAATIASAVAAAAVGGQLRTADVFWSLGAGLGAGLGTLALYRGLAAGRMSVAGPLSAVGAAGLPVLVDVLLGQSPGLTAVIGIALAIPGIWLVSTASSHGGAGGGVVEGLIAGVGFAALFICLGFAGRDAGLWPVVISSAASVLVLIPAVLRPTPEATVAGREPAPSSAAPTTDAIVGPAQPDPAPPRGVIDAARPGPRVRSWPGAQALVPGVLGVLATLLYLQATRAGSLSIAAVITSLYPAVTVLLATVVLKERTTVLHVLGLALCAGSVVTFTLS